MKFFAARGSSSITLALAALLAGGASLASGTQAALAQSGGQEGKGTFVSAISANPTSLFPLTNTDGETDDVADSLFETLADRHWDTFEWKPLIAERWEISPDGKEFTFTIDKRAKFWDGAPVTADDVKFSFDVIFMDGVQAPHLRPYYEKIKKVEVLGKDKIKFTVSDVYYKNFDVVAGLMIFQKKHYMALYAKDKTMTKTVATQSPMGTGQWQIDKWDQNQQVVLKRDQSYWNKERVVKEGRWNSDKQVFKIVQEQNVQFEMLRKGDLTFKALTNKEWELKSDTPEFTQRLNKVKATNKSPVGYGFIGWNNKRAPLDNKDVRWALAHLLNLETWIKKFDYGLSEPTVGPYSVKSDEHDPALKPVPFSAKEARKRLAAAGWTKAGPDGFLVKDGKRLELTILFPVQSRETIEPKLADYKNQAAKVGVLINLKPVEWTSFIKLTEDRNFDGAAMGWTRSVDPDLKQIWHSTSIDNKGSNFVGYSNPEVDKLIDEQRATLDRQKRIELSRRIEKLIHEDQPYAFMTERRYVLYAHPKSVKKDRDTYNYSIGTAFWKLAPQ